VRAPMLAVPNGLDMAEWSHQTAKTNTIISVGRALRGKGHIEAMRAIARALPSRPEWSARFILSDAAAADAEPETLEALREAARALGDRVTIDRNLPFAEVKAAWERAAVGIVLTTGPEPFGRTALEALASGTALITSGLGGLAEVCGDCAVTVDPNDADRIAAALGDLMDAPEWRAKLACAGRKRVEALFDIRSVARRMDEFIEGRVAAGRARS
jgi:glycosyltransferase involved in cell wall biosynthesis